MTEGPSPRDASDRLVHDREAGLARLVEIMRRLRAPDGCPWDREQNFRTIAPYTIEEAYEVADAIERGATADLADELGDLLLQVVYHAQMAAEAGEFAIDDVIRAIADKMVRRHPHVFADAPREGFGAARWEALKAEERAAKGAARDSVLDGAPVALPALTRAVKLQDRAARVGFDWPGAGEVIDKAVEEARELAEARDGGDRDRIEDEYADLMFVMANLGRHLALDPEAALRRANAKFERRFHAVETKLAQRGRSPAQASLAEMDALWDEAKTAERDG